MPLLDEEIMDYYRSYLIIFLGKEKNRANYGHPNWIKGSIKDASKVI